MDFKQTKGTLKNLEENEEISLEEILGFFQDIVIDMEEEQQLTFQEFQLGDEKKITGRLLWISQEISGILKSYQKNIQDSGRALKIEKQSKKLENGMEKLKELEEEVKKLQDSENAVLKQEQEKEKEKKNIEKSISTVRDRISEMNKTITNLEKNLEDLNSSIDTLGTTKKDLISKIQTLDDNMKTINLEVLRKRYEEKAIEYAKLEKEKNGIIQEENNAITNIEKLEKELEDLETEIKTYTNIIEELNRKKEFKTNRAKELEEAQTDLKNWFEGLECKSYDEEICRMEKRVSIMQNAKRELCKAMNLDYFMANEDAKKQMRDFLEELEISFHNIQDGIEDLQKKYRLINNVIYQEGETLL